MDIGRDVAFIMLHVILCCGAISRQCPCKDVRMCDVTVRNSSREIFMFAVSGTNATEYELFDWSQITTIALARYTDDNMMCYAHHKGVRIVLMVGYNGKMLLYNRTRAAWVSMVVRTVVANFLDGVHLDFEDLILKKDYAKRSALLDLFTSLATKLRSINPTYQITIDFNSDPAIPKHAYPYSELMKVADFAFLRTYDQRRWVFPAKPCVAWATDSNNVTIAGFKRFEALGIPAKKLVLGFAWYGFNYACTNNPTLTGRCDVRPVSPGRCTCGTAKTPDYATILERLVPISTGGVHRNNASGAPFINYKDGANSWRQVWYNDPESLRSRYALADRYNLRGVGAWILRDLDFSRTPQATKMRRDMYNALPDWRKDNNYMYM